MPTVLFLCPDHALSSRVAEALFNSDAPPGWRATSAAVETPRAPDRKLSPLLSALRLPTEPMAPRSWDPTLLSLMRTVVTVVEPEGEALPPITRGRLDFRWRRPDPSPLSGMPLLVRKEERWGPVRSLGEFCRERTPRVLG